MAKPMAETGFRQEVRKMEVEPLLPVEKRLIVWSLILGAIGLVVLVWVSYTFFPATP
jgi:hypothetical protein